MNHASCAVHALPTDPGPAVPSNDDERPVVLAGWGGTTRSRARLLEPTDPDQLARALSGARPSLLARGAGLAYGDAAQNAGGHVVDLRRLNTSLLDTETGVLRIDSGVTIADALARTLPSGWVLPAVPGTRHATIGGAVAADVHGKNHRTAGSFARSLISVTVHTAGVARTVDRSVNPDLFWATAGGMGLTGVITDAVIQLERCESTTFLTCTRRTDDLDGTLTALDDAAGDSHAIAWLDPRPPRRGAGRGIVTVSRPVLAGARSVEHRPASRLVGLCPAPLGALAVRAGSALRWPLAGGGARERTEHLYHVLFPLDRFPWWNRSFGRAGLFQWQCAIPLGRERVLHAIVESIRRAGRPARLVTLKALGAANPGPLSFPLPGWTIAADWSAATPGLPDLLDALDRIVAGAGGHLYLAKDARLAPHLLPELIPRLADWRATCDTVDPRRVHTSDLDRRLSLRGPADGGTP